MIQMMINMMIINPITKKTNHGWVRQPSTTLIPRFRSIQSKSLLLVDDDNNDNGDDDLDDEDDGGSVNFNDDAFVHCWDNCRPTV